MESTIKEMKCEQNVLKNTDGSAMYSEGETIVLAGVYGPADCKEAKQDIKQAIVDVNFRPKIGIPGVAEKYNEQFVKGICEACIQRSLHPRTLFSVIVQVMQDRGSLLSCTLNGVSMALQDAGISMSFMPVAISIALITPLNEHDEMETESPADNLKIVFNPSLEEEATAVANLTFVFDSVKSNLISTYAKGPMDSEQYSQCLSAAKTASEKVVQFFRSSVAKKMLAEID